MCQNKEVIEMEAMKKEKGVSGFDENKFKELILYIAKKSKDDRKFGAVKLNKILYYSDFKAYRLLGHSITGAEYQNLGEGPAPRQLLPIRSELINNGDAEMEYRDYFNGIQHRLIAKRKPNTKIFSRCELDIVKEVIEALWNEDAYGASDKSHKELGWLLTEEGETIPYSSAFFSCEPLTSEQVGLGLEIAKNHDLLEKSVV
jgi:hypothetical protein